MAHISALKSYLTNAAVLGDLKQRHSTSRNAELGQIVHKNEPSLEIDVNSEALRSSTL